MLRRVLAAAVVALVLVVPAAAQTKAHRLVVAVAKTMPARDEKTLAVLVLIRRDGGPPAGGLARPGKPLTVLQQSGGVYRITAEIDSHCTGSCVAPSYRISGSGDHALEVVPRCRRTSSGFVCTRVELVKLD